jgi:hypothetical protein
MRGVWCWDLPDELHWFESWYLYTLFVFMPSGTILVWLWKHKRWSLYGLLVVLRAWKLFFWLRWQQSWFLRDLPCVSRGNVLHLPRHEFRNLCCMPVVRFCCSNTEHCDGERGL